MVDYCKLVFILPKNKQKKKPHNKIKPTKNNTKAAPPKYSTEKKKSTLLLRY